jgi:peptidylprolyl isomerase
MNVSKNDFIEIEYTGRLADGNAVFDTTIKAVADKEGLSQKDSVYKPIIVCVGEGQIIKGIDEVLVGKDIPSEFKLTVTPELGFGKKSAKLLRMIPMNVFKKQNIMPQPGIAVQIDGQMGYIRSVSGGRVIVDFNNPLSGKDLNYEVKINRKIENTTEKIKALILNIFGDVKVEFNEGKAKINMVYKLPPELTNPISENIKRLISEINEIEYIAPEPKKTEEKKEIAAEIKTEAENTGSEEKKELAEKTKKTKKATTQK